jgi:hypothetical protein
MTVRPSYDEMWLSHKRECDYVVRSSNKLRQYFEILRSTSSTSKYEVLGIVVVVYK